MVGWKAPPKPQTKNEPLKQPTASQTESAKRLSQGLSVANTVRQRNASQAVSIMQNFESQYSVVLDPQEYNNSGNTIANNNSNNNNPGMMNGAAAPQMAANFGQPMQNGVYSNGNYVLWPSTKAHR